MRLQLALNPVVPDATAQLTVADLAGNSIATLNAFLGNVIIPLSGNFNVSGTITPKNDVPFALDNASLTVYSSAPTVQSFSLTPANCTTQSGQSTTCPAQFIVTFSLKATSLIGLNQVKMDFGDNNPQTFNVSDLAFNSATSTYTFSHQFDASIPNTTYNINGVVTDLDNQSSPLPTGKTVTIY